MTESRQADSSKQLTVNLASKPSVCYSSRLKKRCGQRSSYRDDIIKIGGQKDSKEPHKI